MTLDPRPTVLCLAAVVAVAAGCSERGSGSTAVEPERSPEVTHEGPVTLVDGEVLVSCGSRSQGWPPSAMVDGISPPEPATAITSALSAHPVEPRLRKDWKVLAADDDEITLALGAWGEDGPARDAQFVVLEPDADGWRASNGGNCWRLSPVLDQDAIWVQVDASVAVPGDATDVGVDVKETACASARDPLPHLHEPSFVVGDESVLVYWTSESPGAAECPDNPTVRTTLTLDEPLGDRPLLDGSRWPPVLIGRDD